jgi:hypothetical protein
MAFWNRGRAQRDPQESEIMAVLRELPVVRKELDAREAKKHTAWLAEKAKHRTALAGLEVDRAAAEKREDKEIAVAVEAYAKAQECLGQLEVERHLRRGQHERQVMQHAGALKSLGAPALDACYAEAQRQIEALRTYRVGWQDRPALERHMLALISVREMAEGGVTRGGDETDEEYVARLWESVPPCPAPSRHAPAPEVTPEERQRRLFAASAFSTAHLRNN